MNLSESYVCAPRSSCRGAWMKAHQLCRCLLPQCVCMVIAAGAGIVWSFLLPFQVSKRSAVLDFFAVVEVFSHHAATRVLDNGRVGRMVLSQWGAACGKTVRGHCKRTGLGRRCAPRHIRCNFAAGAEAKCTLSPCGTPLTFFNKHSGSVMHVVPVRHVVMIVHQITESSRL